MFGKKNVFQTVIMSAVFVLLTLPTTPLLSQDQEEKSDVEKKTEELFKMSLEELMNVKVTTADKTEEKIADIPASVVLITREDIEMYGYKTLSEILQNIPGLYSINDYMKGGANFGVRGFWSGMINDNMIILVNGVDQVYDMASQYPLINMAIPVEAIDRIEVIRGPMSVIYGNGAFYGAINIFTTKTPEEESVSLVSGSLGTEKTRKLFLRAAGENDDFYYVLNASIYNTYGIDEPLDAMISNPANLPLYGVPVESKTGGKLEDDEKYLNFSGIFKGFYVNLSYNETKDEFYFNLPSFSYGTYVRNQTTHLSFGYSKELSDTLTLEGKFTYSETREWQKYNYLFDEFYGVEVFDANAFQVEFDAFITPTSDLKINTGLYYRSILNATDMPNLPSFGNPLLENIDIRLAEDDNIVTQAIYAQVSYNPIDSLRLVAGIRLEQSPKYGIIKELGIETEMYTKLEGDYEREKVEIIPRFAAIYYLNDDNIFKFLFGKAINRPSFFQNSFNSLDPDPNVVDLKPESIQTLELNYITSISSYLNLNISIFRNTLENLITRVVEFDPTTNEYYSWSDNAGKMITNGIEMTLKAEPFENFRFELSGVYQETKDKRSDYEVSDVNVAYSPNFLGYLKASYRTEYFTLAVTGNYVGSMDTFWDETRGNPEGAPKGSRIGEKVDSYFVLGANLRIEDVLLDGLFLNIRCSNLLDEEIRYPTFTNNPWANKGTIGLGRSFLVSLGYKF